MIRNLAHHRFALLALQIVLISLPLLQATAQNNSVNPGINDKFLSETLEIAEWRKRFEGESRQIYAHRKEIVAALKLRDKQRVADIGAGTGLFSELFARAVGHNGLVWALEISPKFIEHMQDRFSQADLDQIEVVENTERSTGLAESSIDLAFLCDVYHHFEYPEDMLRNLAYVLRWGGSLVIIDFERIPGETSNFIMNHVRAGKDVFRKEIEAAGFSFKEEIKIEGLTDNYILRFVRR
ncbi:MAG: class I SAM-dependent methyltransferase [Myxococcales bacterium]|nr:class I SAM-dependent methyltransferase [Myxococcales bacterium]